jgi:VanZ family protein
VSARSWPPLLAAAAIVCVAAWQPFDFSLDVGTWASRARALQHDPWQFTVVTDEGVELLRFALLGLTAGLWLQELRVPRARAWAAAGGVTAAFLLESSQLIIESRMPGLEDALVHASGAVLGVALSVRWPHGRSDKFWTMVLWVASATAVAAQLLSPFEVAATRRAFNWLPFWSYYERTSLQTVSHAMEHLLFFLPLGFVIRWSGMARARWWGLALVLTVAAAAPIEYGQGWIVGRYPDVTDVALMVGGALAGGLLCGEVFPRAGRVRARRASPPSGR